MNDLPTGLVTFLFTDIEGSTRLMERLGSEYELAHAQHDAIIRQAIGSANGRVVNTEGDSFFAVFQSPTAAVSAAATAQRALHAAAWPAEATVRVRIGLHTGEGRQGGDNYIGLDVNRTARIAQAAHGGQIVVSDATRALVQRDLPEGVRLLDLGEHRLRDLSEPERLYQLVVEGLPSDFAGPRAVALVSHNLPSEMTRFVGRQREKQELIEMLSEHRLVTLTGPGGAGKTRLALEVARNVLGEYRAGVFFVDLSPVGQPELVPDTIAAALGVREEPGRPLLSSLARYLRDRVLLLVLDNFEQVIDAGSTVVEPLLRGAPALRALVTSRVPLHLYGEYEYKVAPLLEQDAVVLFAERAAAGRPGFRLTTDNMPSVAAITSRLDGLPLAIELAASRVKLLPPDKLLARLERRLPLLTAQDRKLPERQRTVRQTIDWSYELLEQPERALFWRLSAFAGGADLDAIEAVANPAGDAGLDTLDGLSSLVDKNLVHSAESDGAGARFTMLETIREYGLERLAESGEEPTIRRRHAEHWINVAEGAQSGLMGPQVAEWSRRLDKDHDNFRAALIWALAAREAELGLRLAAALRYFWRLAGHFSEGLRWLEALLSLPEAASRSVHRARALIAGGDLASWIGALDEQLRYAGEAVSTYRELDERGELAAALEEYGVALLFSGRREEARAALAEGRELFSEGGDDQGLAECRVALALLALFEGRPEAARAELEPALEHFRQTGDPYWTSMAELTLAYAAILLGDLDAGRAQLQSSLAMALEHGIDMVVGNALLAFARLAFDGGEHERAMRLVGASEAIRQRMGEVYSVDEDIIGDVGAAARAMLQADVADRLYMEGRELPRDEAAALALGSSTQSG